jgi:outer membrane lipoprotein-sorting protein
LEERLGMSDTRRSIRLTAAAVGFLVTSTLLAQAPAAKLEQARAEQVSEVSQLMAAFSRMPGLEARFVEEKKLGLLAKPLSSSGRLYFARPGLLLRRVEQPQASEVIITPQELKLKDASGEQRIDLSSRPDVRPFVESLTWLLAGDEKALAGVYKLEFTPPQAAGPWQLTLTPKAEPLAHLIAYIRIVGQGLAVSEIQVREKGGDETVTRIVEANPARKFAPSELSSLFGVKPK